MDNIDVLSNVVVFFMVALIFILCLAVYFKITLKNYNVQNENKLKFYGLFLGLDNKSIIAFSMITLNFIFLAWIIVSFISLNVIYIILSYMLVIISCLITKQYNRAIVNMLYNSVNIILAFIVKYVYDYFVIEGSLYLLIILILLIVFIFLYLLYITFKWLNEIILQNKYLAKKKYKKI